MNSLYRIGGAAALLAGVLLRRNLGVEIALFSPQKPPATVDGWFALLQSNRLLGLTYLNIFDIANYVLVGLMLLALYAALKAVSPSYMAVALSLGLLGIALRRAWRRHFPSRNRTRRRARYSTLAGHSGPQGRASGR